MYVSKPVLIIKKVYDILVPSGRIVQDMDKKHGFNDWSSNKRTTNPSFLDVLSIFGVLMWMFMLKWLLDFLGLAGEIIFFLLIPLSAISHLIGEIDNKSKELETTDVSIPKGRIIEIFLIQIIYVGIAFFSLRGFIGHTILSEVVAADIGWATGSPFQYELAVYHLGFGVAALIGFWRRDSLWIGLIYAKSIFLFGAAGVHIWDIIVNNNFSHGNFGVTLFGNDLLLPIAAIVLLHFVLYDKTKLTKSNLASLL